MLQHLRAAGINVDDALAVMLAVRRLGRATIEEVGLAEEDRRNPTDLARIGNDSRVAALDALRNAGIERTQGMTVALVSTDIHVFAKQTLEAVLEDWGARVIDCGVSADPEQVVANARNHNCRAIVVTTHNGWALNFGRRLMAAIDDHRALPVVMGGVLNEDAPGSPVPCDVSKPLRELGVHTTNDMVELIRLLSEWERKTLTAVAEGGTEAPVALNVDGFFGMDPLGSRCPTALDIGMRPITVRGAAVASGDGRRLRALHEPRDLLRNPKLGGHQPRSRQSQNHIARYQRCWRQTNTPPSRRRLPTPPASEAVVGRDLCGDRFQCAGVRTLGPTVVSSFLGRAYWCSVKASLVHCQRVRPTSEGR